MSAFILLFIATCAAASPFATKQENELKFQTSISGSPFYQDPKTCCSNRDVTIEYLNSITKFAIKAYKTVSLRSNHQFVFSPTAMWIILAAIAEGADWDYQQDMFKYLGLPSDICLRQQYYRLATSRISPGDDVNVFDTRTLVIDENLQINFNWYNFVKNNFLIDVVSAPIKRRPDVAAREMRRVIGGSLQSFNLIGNSVILDAVDYNGLWATSFRDAVLERAPFFNQAGTKIGSVDLMRVKRKIRVAHLPKANLKIIEIPVGIGNRYRMLFAVILDDTDIKTIMESFHEGILMGFLDAVEESHIALDVAIPRFTLTSEMDARVILEDIGVKSLWTEAGATRFISSPPALPSSFVQRTTITIDREGLGPPELVSTPPGNAPTGLDPAIGRGFVADRPFLFALFDAETYSILIASVYTQPTYSD